MKKFTIAATACPTTAGVRDQLDARRVAVRRAERDVARVERALLVEQRAEERAAALARGLLGVTRERAAAGERLEAVHVAAAADHVVAVRHRDLDVADVAGAALRAAVQLAVAR